MLLQKLLKENGGYDDRYAKWLSVNLHCLNEISVKLLDEFGSGSEHLVRFSLVI
jgi:hypothetical protein